MWHVTVQKGDGSARVLVVKHLIFALGFRGGDPYMPQYPGMVTSFSCASSERAE